MIRLHRSKCLIHHALQFLPNKAGYIAKPEKKHKSVL